MNKAQYYYITTGLYICVLYRSPHISNFKFSPSISGKIYPSEYLVIIGSSTTHTSLLHYHYTTYIPIPFSFWIIFDFTRYCKWNWSVVVVVEIVVVVVVVVLVVSVLLWYICIYMLYRSPHSSDFIFSPLLSGKINKEFF